ncbi:MAG: peptide chain release factor N(5)-glutamine methyltransferase [Rothia sp. (in: high G+C Gram-positive bacteria)]|nr:peptide chain release factor N(5)-glutamine methyltransferase [Rothia sp. (in: high G+C Gram-positive bacteria)]
MSEFSLQPGDELAVALRRAAAYLAECGVENATVDAELIAAYLFEKDGAGIISRGRVQALALLGSPVPAGFEELVNLRGQRIPLQHLTGQAHFRQLALSVGPGVFIPRPETELLVDYALAAYRQLVEQGQNGVMVDLCTGSGAIAASLAFEEPGASVHAVELSQTAHAWAEKNLEPHGVNLVHGDALTALEELRGTVTVVASNPPYIPADAVPKDPEVRDHDPKMALYGGGEDGMQLPRAITARAFDLLAPGGFFIVEHAETQQELMASALQVAGFERVVSIDDFAGKPRHTSGYKPLKV